MGSGGTEEILNLFNDIKTRFMHLGLKKENGHLCHVYLYRHSAFWHRLCSVSIPIPGAALW